MSAAYPPRYRATCPCGWSMQAFDKHVADGAAQAHGVLKSGHEAAVIPC